MQVPCLSIMQPWSWLIVNRFKTIENRDWQPEQSIMRELPMRVLIHTGKKPDPRCVGNGQFIRPYSRIGQLFPECYEWEQAQEECNQLGGIVGAATLVAVVSQSNNPWFVGKYGFVLEDTMPLPFMPLSGKPGFFYVDYDKVAAHMSNRCFCCGHLEYGDGLLCDCHDGRCTGCRRCNAHCLCLSVVQNDAILFYSPRERPYGCFSNFSAHPFKLDGVWWPSSEHYFQAHKFVGTPYAEKIRFARTSKEAANLGRERAFPLRADWERVKNDVMYRAVLRKFETHADIRAILLATGNKEIVENSATDSYWGCGYNGNGRNMLGKTLMRVRQALREHGQYEKSDMSDVSGFLEQMTLQFGLKAV